jgi:hypothetical protein
MQIIPQALMEWFWLGGAHSSCGLHESSLLPWLQ